MWTHMLQELHGRKLFVNNMAQRVAEVLQQSAPSLQNEELTSHVTANNLRVLLETAI